MANSARPNVLFLFSDQQRHDTVGCYGDNMGSYFNLTPNLDRLAAEGTRFNLHMSCQPVCGPARAAIQTGLYPNGIGCHVNDTRLPAGLPTIADYFNEAGYETAYVGKWHLASHHSFQAEAPDRLDYKITAIPPELRGGYKDFWIASDVLEFTSTGYGGYMWDGEMKKRSFDHYRVDATTDFALEYLKKPKEHPFFMMVSYIEPHHQNDAHETQGPAGSREKYKDFPVPGDLQGTEGDWRENLPDYLGCCKSLDDNVGRIVEVLKEQGLYENTVILYSSDHGSHFRTRNSEYKRSCQDDSLHVPLIASGPGFTGGHVISELTSLIDLAPTFLAAAGIGKPEEMAGTPLQTLVEQPTKAIHDAVFVQISESCVGRAIRTRDYTYCVEMPEDPAAPYGGLLEPLSDLYQEAYLYDLRKDPYQRHNRISDPDYEEVRKELRETLLSYIEAYDHNEPKIIPAGKAQTSE